MSIIDTATKIATTLIEGGELAADRRGAATALILATLRQSPPDIAKDYEAAKRELLGDKDELEK